MEVIRIKGARVNNLKDVELELPLNKITCISGPSGSGKSTLAFHTLFNESKRRFMNSFPNYLKMFGERPTSVDVDEIYPVLPVFGLPQINPVIGSRSVVADLLRIPDFFQSLFGHNADEVCPTHNLMLKREDISSKIKKSFKKDKSFHLFINKNQFKKIYENLPFPSRCFDGEKVVTFDEGQDWWEISRVKLDNINKINELTKKFPVGLEILIYGRDTKNSKIIKIEKELKCPKCDYTTLRLTPASFNPYNALGACDKCQGYGANLVYDEDKLIEHHKSINEDGVKFLNYKRFATQKKHFLTEAKKRKIPLTKVINSLDEKAIKFFYEGGGKYYGFNKLFKYLESKKYKAPVRIFIRNIQKEQLCEVCEGTRLNYNIEGYKIQFGKNLKNIKELYSLNIEDLYYLLKEIDELDEAGKKLINKISKTLSVAKDLGLGHLSLLRKTKSLSAGEYQRLLLVKYLSYDGTGSLFLFDEPSLGLSETDLKKLLKAFNELIKQNNTIILVDHSMFLKKNSDYLVEMGPGSGIYGGEILYKGLPKKYKFIHEKFEISPKKLSKKSFSLSGFKIYGKKFKDIKFNSEGIIWVHGKSGSGKTSLFIHGLANHINFELNGEYLTNVKSEYKKINYPDNLEDVILINSDLNRFSSRSTVGSMTDLSTVLRKHYAKLNISKILDLKDGHFSPNSKLGQCESCEGKGVKVIEMQFMEDIILECEVCHGLKLKNEISNISDGYNTISEAYSLPLEHVFKNIKLTPKYKNILRYIEILNLQYLSLERKISSLSGGEKQRIYLLSKLIKKVENSLVIIENVSFGLSEKELVKLAEFFNVLSLKGNTIVLIDQNPFFNKCSSAQIEL